MRRIEPDKWLNIPPPVSEASQVFKDELLRLFAMNTKTQETVTKTTKNVLETSQRAEGDQAQKTEELKQDNNKRFKEIENSTKNSQQLLKD